MMFGTCAREKEVAELLLRGRWPHACSAELRAHVAACRACSDLVLVTQNFRSAHADAAALAFDKLDVEKGMQIRSPAGWILTPSEAVALSST